MLQAPAPSDADQKSVRSFSTLPPYSTVVGGIASPWKEAAELLKTSTNWDEILLVLRFIPLDRNATIELLSGRWRPILDTWLNFLYGSRTRPHYCNSNACAATEIVDMVNQRYFLSAGPSWDGEWLFLSMESSVDIATIAQRWDLSIRAVFCWIPYERLTPWAFGLEDNVALNFLNTIESFNARCVQHVRNLEGKGTEKWRLLAEASLLTCRGQSITDLYTRNCDIDTLCRSGRFLPARLPATRPSRSTLFIS